MLPIVARADAALSKLIWIERESTGVGETCGRSSQERRLTNCRPCDEVLTEQDEIDAQHHDAPSGQLMILGTFHFEDAGLMTPPLPGSRRP